MPKRCSLSIAKATTSSTLMRHGYPVLTLDVHAGTLVTTQTLSQIRSSVKESIWLQQSHLKVSHGYHLPSAIQMKRWCKCSSQGWLRHWHNSMVLCGESKLSLLWMVHRITEVQRRASVSVTWIWKWYWVRLIATSLPLPNCGSRISKEDRSIRMRSRLGKSKCSLIFWLVLVRSRKYRSSSTNRHLRSSQTESYYCFIIQSCIFSTTSVSSLCESWYWFIKAYHLNLCVYLVWFYETGFGFYAIFLFCLWKLWVYNQYFCNLS